MYLQGNHRLRRHEKLGGLSWPRPHGLHTHALCLFVALSHAGGRVDVTEEFPFLVTKLSAVP
jgi:hypothetical protein